MSFDAKDNSTYSGFFTNRLKKRIKPVYFTLSMFFAGS